MTGAPATGISMAASSNFGCWTCDHFDASAASSASASVLPALMASMTTPASDVLYAHDGSTTRHWASLLLQPQGQSRSRRIFRTVVFWAADRPPKLTPGSDSALCQF